MSEIKTPAPSLEARVREWCEMYNGAGDRDEASILEFVRAELAAWDQTIAALREAMVTLLPLARAAAYRDGAPSFLDNAALQRANALLAGRTPGTGTA